MVVTVMNPFSRGGKGAALWSQVAPSLGLGTDYVVDSKISFNWLPDFLHKTYLKNPGRELRVVAAGGDGTIHGVLNALYSLQKQHKIPKGSWCIGAVGLGTSNDYHRPFSGKVISGIPIKLDFENARVSDLIHISGEVDRFKRIEKVTAMSASVGLLALGNEIYDEGHFGINRLKKRSVKAAIRLAGALAFLRHQNLSSISTVFHGNSVQKMKLTNASIFLKPHFSGQYYYQHPVKANHFGVAIANGLNKYELAKVMLGLEKGKFDIKDKCQIFDSEKIRFAFDQSVLLEVDGEISRAQNFTFELYPQAAKFCV